MGDSPASGWRPPPVAALPSRSASSRGPAAWPDMIPVMTENANAVLRDALALPLDERAQVAADLLASLDATRDDLPEVATAWADELERRAREVLGVAASDEDWDIVRGRIADRLHSG